MACRGVCAAVCLVVLANGRSQTDPASFVPRGLAEAGYQVRQWGVDDGLPGGGAICVLQTSDGYVWAGYETGLVRFDGARFKQFQPGGSEGLPFGEMLELFEDSAGRLIAVHRGEHPLTAFDGSAFASLGEGSLLDTSKERVAWSKDGTIWKLETRTGVVSRLEGNRFEEVLRVDLTDVPGVNSFGVDEEQPWIIGRQGLYRLTENGATPVPELDTDSEGRRPSTGEFIRGSDDSLVYLTDNALHQIQGNRRIHLRDVPKSLRDPLDSLTRPAAVMDAFGNLWVNWDLNQRHLSVWSETQGVFGGLVGRGGFFHSIAVSFDGSVWVGASDGLFQYSPIPFQTPEELRHLPDARVITTAVDAQDRLWLLNDHHLSRFDPETGEMLEIPIQELRIKNSLMALGPSTDGTVWVAESGGDVHRLDAGGTRVLETVRVPREREAVMFRVLETSDGRMWVIASSGVWWKREGQMVQDGIPDGLKGERSSGVGPAGLDDQGRLHVCGIGKYFVYEDGVWRHQFLPDRMRSRLPMGLEFDVSGNGWLLGGNLGGVVIACLRDGLWSTFEDDATGLDVRVGGLRLDRSNGLWVSSLEHGLFRFSRANLLDYADGRAERIVRTRYTAADGLPSTRSPEWRSRGMCLTSDGRLWVPTIGGVTSVDPDRLRRVEALRARPNTRIEELLLDNIQLPMASAHTGDHPAIIPSGVRRLEIRYTGVYLSDSDKVRFRYRLAPYDAGWVNAEKRRAAFYQELPPGHYRFEVTSALETEPWDGTIATLSLQVMPQWWQTAWCRLGSAGLLITLGWAAYVARTRRFRREETRQREFSRGLIQAQEQERQRIASELHDGLGQELLLIKNGNQMMARKLPEDPDLRERARKIGDLSAKALQSVRAITLDLRPPELDRLGLAAAVEGMLETAADHSSLEVTCDVEALEGAVEKGDEIHLFRIVQEALNNALKHAQASRVHVEARRARGVLVVTVQDDGQGFDPAGAGSHRGRGGLGLPGLRERSRHLGGALGIESSPEAGTTVTLRMFERHNE